MNDRGPQGKPIVEASGPVNVVIDAFRRVGAWISMKRKERALDRLIEREWKTRPEWKVRS